MCAGPGPRTVEAVPTAPPTRLRRPPPVDVLVAAALAAALVVITPRLPADTPGERAIDVYALVLVAFAAGSLAWRRVVPGITLAVSAAAVGLYALADYTGGPVYVVPLVAIVTIASLDGRRAAMVPAALVTVGLTIAALVQHPTYVMVLVHLMWASWAVAAVLIGDTVRTRALQIAALRERARVLEETREEEARRRVAEERVRIARDLHDVVAHSLASISIQAGMGAHVMERRPDEARTALLAIKQASKEALDELRATLDVLREGDGAAPTAPTAGLALLDTLRAVAEQAGVPVTIEVAGPDDRRLPAAVDVTAYRIVQESLTNVMRHAGPASAGVRVVHGDGVLEIDVVDDGTGATGPVEESDGHGITGMRERAALLGGRVVAGPRTDGPGFRVHAVLPVPGASPDPTDAPDSTDPTDRTDTTDPVRA